MGGSKITADGDCSHEIKRRLLLGRKAVTNLDIILKSRDRGCPVKAVVFPVVTYGCESWTIKKAEFLRIDDFDNSKDVHGRKAMTSLDSILKSRNITLLTKIRIIKAIGFPVVTYGCESWAVKKAEH